MDGVLVKLTPSRRRILSALKRPAITTLPCRMDSKNGSQHALSVFQRTIKSMRPPHQPPNQIATSRGSHAMPCCASSFMARAVHAYHRSERDGIALMGEAFGCGPAEEWPGASSRVRRDRDSSKLWSWAMRRWGREAWPALEYRIRESSRNSVVDHPAATKLCRSCGVAAKWSSADCPICFGDLMTVTAQDIAVTMPPRVGVDL